MILDERNYKLYICGFNTYIKLTKNETKLMYFFIRKKDNKINLYDIISYLYETKENLSSYVYTVRNLICKINSKLKDYNIKIAAKNSIGYYLKQEVSPKFIQWKKQFFKIHKEEALLLDLYSKKEITINHLQELEKKIKTLEKNII